jgi:hypothetical protein
MLVSVVVWEMVWLNPLGPVTTIFTVAPEGTPVTFTVRLPGTESGGGWEEDSPPPPQAVVKMQAIRTIQPDFRTLLASCELELHQPSCPA